ncbi:hypothetical protein DFJ73DRAFT_847649 [Zopfochytrium polystomum]|nr:hypothetical protein DFJ73DRAFT_847649 [Zopfochytrium polystomum]
MASPQDLAHRWLELDKNPATRNEIQTLLDAGNVAELERKLRNPIKFGTAGLRAAMEAGFAGMNELTVIQASQGLAKYVKETVPDAIERGVVIGHDHRHHSETFARLTAAVFLNEGYTKVYLYRGLVHTPMVPFGVKRLRAAVGVMVTASHNPKQDNGYKVYWENGCQIISPHDSGIAKQIALNQVPAVWDANLCDSHPACIDRTQEMIEAYFKTFDQLVLNREGNATTDLKVVYTPLHGVGLPFAERSLAAFNLPKFAVVVPSQAKPDPDFPTLAFPNPEERGALDEALRVATEVGAQLVVANDPDADRFAAAEYWPEESRWFTFTGDQLGAIFAYGLLQNARQLGTIPDAQIAMVSTAVSSSMVRSMAEVEGFHFEQTLTGFKWMGNRCVELSTTMTPKFAYEEAIGFMVNPEAVLDKDGVSALGVFLELAVKQRALGRTMRQYLEDLYEKFGFHQSANHYFLCHDPQLIQRIFEKIRFGAADSSDWSHRTEFKRDGKTLRYPKSLAGVPISYIRDLTVDFEVEKLDELGAKGAPIEVGPKEYRASLPLSPEMITFRFQDGIVTLRTSGTEPKIKYYIEKRGSNRAQVAKDLQSVVEAVGRELLEASTNGLK